MPRSIRSVRQPKRYIDCSDSEEVSSDGSTYKEEETCQECLIDDGVAAEIMLVVAAVNVGFTKNVLKSVS